MPINNRYNIFYERQSGGLCRLHSLNAFFGYSKITPSMFQKWIRLYDTYLKTRFNIKTSSSSYDLVNSDQTNLVSYILKKYRIHLRYYALNSIYGKPLNKEVIDANFIFVYNFGHIWGVRKKNGKYYKVDSLNGVTPFNINSLSSMKNIGILVPVSLRNEWNLKVRQIKNILLSNNINNKIDLMNYLAKLHSQKKILDKLEIPLGVSISILEMQLPRPYNPLFKNIYDIVNSYNTFIKQFTNKRYNDINLINNFVPDIIFSLISLQ